MPVSERFPKSKTITREAVIAIGRKLTGGGPSDDILDKPLGEHGEEMIDALMFEFLVTMSFFAPQGSAKLTVRELLRQLGL